MLKAGRLGRLAGPACRAAWPAQDPLPRIPPFPHPIHTHKLSLPQNKTTSQAKCAERERRRTCMVSRTSRRGWRTPSVRRSCGRLCPTSSRPCTSAWIWRRTSASGGAPRHSAGGTPPTNSQPACAAVTAGGAGGTRARQPVGSDAKETWAEIQSCAGHGGQRCYSVGRCRGRRQARQQGLTWVAVRVQYVVASRVHDAHLGGEVLHAPLAWQAEVGTLDIQCQQLFYLQAWQGR